MGCPPIAVNYIEIVSVVNVIAFHAELSSSSLTYRSLKYLNAVDHYPDHTRRLIVKIWDKAERAPEA